MSWVFQVGTWLLGLDLRSEEWHEVDLGLDSPSIVLLASDGLAQVLEERRYRIRGLQEVVGLGSLHAHCDCVDLGITCNILRSLALLGIE